MEEVILPSMVTYPKRVQSDNGLEFQNKKLMAVLDKYKIQHITSAPFYPASNGLVERLVKTLRTWLNTSLMGSPDWEAKLPELAYIYNHTKHSQTNMKPAEVFLGKACRVVPILSPNTKNYRTPRKESRY